MPNDGIMLAALGAGNALPTLVRRNNAKITDIWGQTARTLIPEVPITGIPYRRDDLPDSDVEAGQAYGYIYDDARYNQVLFLLCSLWQSMCENGGMPFLKGQHYQAGGLMLYDGKYWCALREIFENEDPYPMPYESPYWYDLSPKSFVPNTKSSDGALGLVPAPKKGEQSYMLANNAIWTKYANPFPTGSIIAYAGKKSPSNEWLYCDGSIVKRSDYKALFAVIGTKYGAGDGTTTFALPDLRNKVLEGAGVLGTLGYISAGVPTQIHTHSASLKQAAAHNHSMSTTAAGNHSHTRGTWNITGKFSADQFSAFSYPQGGDAHSKADGAFYCTNDEWFAGTSKGADRSVLFRFDANRNWTGATNETGNHNHTWSITSGGDHSHGTTIDKNQEVNNNIFGKSNTVQMAACTCNFLIKA